MCQTLLWALEIQGREQNPQLLCAYIIVRVTKNKQDKKVKYIVLQILAKVKLCFYLSISNTIYFLYLFRKKEGKRDEKCSVRG